MAQNLNANQPIQVIELRNYLIKPGQRDQFIAYFEEHFIDSQNVLGGYTLGQYRIKGVEDRFFWIRGFKDMAARSEFLPAFYSGPVWKQHRNMANAMLLNNDYVHLVKPLSLAKHTQATETAINSNELGKGNGIAVIDYYIANQKLGKLIAFFETKYAGILQASGIPTPSLWISETSPNDFVALPVFQDQNLLVALTFYKNESDYETKMKAIQTHMTEELKNEMHDLVTIKNSLILYPTLKSFSVAK